MLSNVSVIIPVYNTQEFLGECVDSVLAQTHPNIEIVLVDDGSTDGSGALCDEYAQLHSNRTHTVVALHKPNGGLADARNYGIQHATGDYLLFLDSDDYYLSTGAIETLIRTATETNSDVVCFNYTRSQQHTPERKCDKMFTDDISFLVTSNVYTSSACLKLIRRDLLLAQQIDFIKGQLSEDILFSGKLLANPQNKICFVNEVLYYYRVRGNSITNTLKLKNITDMIAILHALEAECGLRNTANGNMVNNASADANLTAEEIANNVNTTAMAMASDVNMLSDNGNKNADDAPTAKHANLLAYTAFQYATLLINMHLCAQPIPASAQAEIFALRYLLQYNHTGIVRIIYLCTRLIGIGNTSRLMALAFRGKQVFCK